MKRRVLKVDFVPALYTTAVRHFDRILSQLL
jgi:hypothetical protein